MHFRNEGTTITGLNLKGIIKIRITTEKLIDLNTKEKILINQLTPDTQNKSKILKVLVEIYITIFPTPEILSDNI